MNKKLSLRPAPSVLQLHRPYLPAIVILVAAVLPAVGLFFGLGHTPNPAFRCVLKIYLIWISPSKSMGSAYGDRTRPVAKESSSCEGKIDSRKGRIKGGYSPTYSASLGPTI
jgi:hypothetical protein